MLRLRLAGTLSLLLAAVASAQAPWVESHQPVVVFPDSVSSETIWARAEYMVWVVTTQRGLELGQELNQNPLFNRLQGLTGVNRTDMLEVAIRNRYGYRYSGGVWFHPKFGVEGSYMYLARRPFVVPLSSGNVSELGEVAPTVGLPGVTGAGGGGTVVVPFNVAGIVTGNVTFELSDTTVEDYQILGRAKLFDNGAIRFDGLLGARLLRVEESLAISAQATGQALPVIAGSSVFTRDGVDTETTYKGGVVGFDFECGWHGWYAGIRPTATIAQVRNVVNAQAFAQASVSGVGTVSVDAGSYLPLIGLGRKTRTDWTVIPQVDLRLARDLGSFVRVMVGGSFIMLPSVSRAAGQFELGLPVDRLLPNVGGVPQLGELLPPAREDMFLLTASVGVEVRF